MLVEALVFSSRRLFLSLIRPLRWATCTLFTLVCMPRLLPAHTYHAFIPRDIGVWLITNVPCAPKTVRETISDIYSLERRIGLS